MGTQTTEPTWAQMQFARMLLVDLLGVQPDVVTADAMLVDDLGADSLDLIEIQMVMQEKGIEAPDEAFAMRMTVRDLAMLIFEQSRA